MPYPLPEDQTFHEYTQKTLQGLRRVLEGKSYDIFIGHCQGAFCVYYALQLIREKKINCPLPKMVIISSMTFNMERILAKDSIEVDRGILTKSIHLIGEDDP